MPDTPYYHIIKGNRNAAIKSLKFLRGQKENEILDEYKKIKLCIDESSLNNNHNKISFMNLFRCKKNLKAFIIAIGLIISQQITGVNVIIFNLQNIFEKSKTINPIIFLSICSLIQIFASFMTTILVDKFGRKKILLISGSIMAIALVSL